VTVFAEVVFPLPVDRSFQYRVPEILLPVIRPGCRVAAPFGRRMLTGFVVAVVEGPPAGGFELKDIHEVLDKTPSFSADFLRFTKKLSARSFTPWGEILAAALPLTLVPRDRKKVSWTPAGREALEKGTLKKRERKLASFLPPGKALSPAFLAKKMGVKSLSSLLARLETKGVLAVRTVPPVRGKRRPLPVRGGRHVSSSSISPGPRRRRRMPSSGGSWRAGPDHSISSGPEKPARRPMPAWSEGLSGHAGESSIWRLRSASARPPLSG
jgi:primosomal protein N'